MAETFRLMFFVQKHGWCVFVERCLPFFRIYLEDKAQRWDGNRKLHPQPSGWFNEKTRARERGYRSPIPFIILDSFVQGDVFFSRIRSHGINHHQMNFTTVCGICFSKHPKKPIQVTRDGFGAILWGFHQQILEKAMHGCEMWDSSRWWFQIVFIFTPTWGRFPF